MNTRKEITKKYALKYRRAGKKGKNEMLDQLVSTIGWLRANDRQDAGSDPQNVPSQRGLNNQTWLSEDVGIRKAD